jgi:branched-chain amino acid transport system ATP-binding protein
MTILIVEQNVRDTLSLATEAYVMISGRIVAHGRSEELIAEGRMEALYLMNEKGKFAREEVSLPGI